MNIFFKMLFAVVIVLTSPGHTFAEPSENVSKRSQFNGMLRMLSKCISSTVILEPTPVYERIGPTGITTISYYPFDWQKGRMFEQQKEDNFYETIAYDYSCMGIVHVRGAFILSRDFFTNVRDEAFLLTHYVMSEGGYKSSLKVKLVPGPEPEFDIYVFSREKRL